VPDVNTTITTRAWILGAPDPEMVAIERLLTEAGETVLHATADGRRVHPGSTYRADPVDSGGAAMVYLVECAPTILIHHATPDRIQTVVIDHHRPRDPGYGRPPSEFLAASSLGQVITELARLGALPSWPHAMSSPADDGPGLGILDYCGPDGWRVGSRTGADDVGCWIPVDIVLCAAADHCLGAAYRGECPGVEPDELMQWRAESPA